MKILLTAVVIISSCSITSNIIASEELNYALFFCPRDDCFEIFRVVIESAKTAHCALYDFDDEIFKNVIAAAIITDENKKLQNKKISVAVENTTALMHNKFCIINSTTVITGSFNPRAAAKDNYNNMIIINSKTLAKNYLNEFYELWNNERNKPTTNTLIRFKNSIIKNYFCPEDECSEKIINELAAAKKEIIFAFFTFTHPPIATELILSHYRNITVKGVLEKRNSNSKYSQYNKLLQQGIEVRLDKTAALMHHKFFVIDNRTVIVGSFNPTKSADKKNHENILIIQNKEIALLYAKEFDNIWRQSAAKTN
jgi:phosphatidylserine/phosphatidylglycerophosphate/cardiolipin synthase-like enzyme